MLVFHSNPTSCTLSCWLRLLSPRPEPWSPLFPLPRVPGVVAGFCEPLSTSTRTILVSNTRTTEKTESLTKCSSLLISKSPDGNWQNVADLVGTGERETSPVKRDQLADRGNVLTSVLSPWQIHLGKRQSEQYPPTLLFASARRGWCSFRGIVAWLKLNCDRTPKVAVTYSLGCLAQVSSVSRRFRSDPKLHLTISFFMELRLQTATSA